MPYPFIQNLFINHYKNLTMNEAVSLHRLNILIAQTVAEIVILLRYSNF